MYSLAGLSLLNSVLCRRWRDAIVLTYLMALGYLMLANASWGFLVWATLGRYWPELATFPSTATWTSPITVQDLVDGFNAGNIVQAISRLLGRGAGAILQQELPRVLGGYALFHAIAGSAFFVWSVLRLRALALREKVAAGPARARGAARGRASVRGRPASDDLERGRVRGQLASQCAGSNRRRRAGAGELPAGDHHPLAISRRRLFLEKHDAEHERCPNARRGHDHRHAHVAGGCGACRRQHPRRAGTQHLRRSADDAADQ